jgi:hypothetical protein
MFNLFKRKKETPNEPMVCEGSIRKITHENGENYLNIRDLIKLLDNYHGMCQDSVGKQVIRKLIQELKTGL